MKTPASRRAIFVVGCPRSGTTYLQSLLAAHPAVASFPETHFFRAVGHSRRARLGFASPRGRERRALRQFLDTIDRPDLAHVLPSRTTWRVTPYVRAWRALLDRLAAEQNARCWVEKTPDHLHFIDEIRHWLPQAHFVHLLRAGADTIASLYDVVTRYPDAWNGPYDLDWCINRWHDDVRRSAAYVGQPGHVWLRYETLKKRPALLDDLLRRLSLTPIRISEAERQAAARLVSGGEPWKTAVRQQRPPAGNKFNQVLTPAQQQYVRQRLQPLPDALHPVLL